MVQPVDTSKAQSVPSSNRLSEISTIGLRISDGRVYEEAREELRWPYSNQTYKVMMYDATIQSAHNAIKSMIRRIKWDVTCDSNEPTDSQKEQVKFIKQCMNDMEHSWGDFINEALSILIYGHSVHEKVFKVRNGRNTRSGKDSLYSDQKIGWAKLPIRSQDTIHRWVYNDYNRKLVAVEQNLALSTSYNGNIKSLPTVITLPAKKVLHFRHDTQRDNPEGSSPLKACYVPWKYKITYEELEGAGVSRDMRGMPVIDLPPEYMSPDAPEDKRAVYDWAVNTIQSMWANESMGLVKPRFIDPESKQDIFGFQLMGVSGGGGKNFDLNAIISRYENKILMTYLADVLKMGQEAHGSFALSDNKTNLLAVGIEAILVELLETINRDLVSQTLLMNGWEVDENSPKITYEDLDERDLDVLGQFIQRCVAVGAIEVDELLSESLRKEARLPSPDRERPIQAEMTSQGTSESGGGMKSGMPNSNGSGGSVDASSANNSNAS